MMLKSGLTVVIAALLFATSAQASGYDPARLRADGEVYVVALHDAYAAAAARAERQGERAVATYFRERVAEVESGGELFPMHPSAYPCADTAQSNALMKAYDETFALTTSEAADVEPLRVANVQVAYEEWLVAMNANSRDEGAEGFADTFELRLDELTDPGPMSALMPAGRRV